MQTNWQNSNHLQDPDYFDYVIFERDSWPAQKQTRERQGREDRLQNPFSIAEPYRLDFRSGKCICNDPTDDRHYEYYQGGFINTTSIFPPYGATYYNQAQIINADIGFKTEKY